MCKGRFLIISVKTRLKFCKNIVLEIFILVLTVTKTGCCLECQKYFDIMVITFLLREGSFVIC